MMKTTAIRGLILASTAALMFVGMGALPVSAQCPQPLGVRGGSRGGPVSPVQAVVKLNGQPVAGVTVTFTATHSVTAVTGSNGVASINLLAGHYTVTASNDSGSATKTINVVESTNALIVGLALAPKTP
jgi:hypothetical protein